MKDADFNPEIEESSEGSSETENVTSHRDSVNLDEYKKFCKENPDFNHKESSQILEDSSDSDYDPELEKENC